MNSRGLFYFVAATISVLSGCATTAKYDAKVQTWVGKDSETLTQTWGIPDATEKLEKGNKMFVYARLRHEPVSYERAKSMVSEHIPSPAGLYIKCSTYFEVDPQNQIDDVIFVGDECVANND